MTARDPMPVGTRVAWDGSPHEYVVWSLHDKSGWRWITREGAERAVPAKMTSLRVIGHAATPAPAPPYEPRTHARATDPDTSAAAARDVKVRAGTQMARLLAAYATRDALTDHEAALAADLAHTGYWKRCADLRDAGLIEDTGDRVMGHQGSHVMTCRITDKGRGAHRGA